MLLIDENEAAFITLREEILGRSGGEKPQLRSYLDEVGHIMTSNLWWATVSDRYEPGGLAWDGTVPATLTLHRDHTDVTPVHTPYDPPSTTGHLRRGSSRSGTGHEAGHAPACWTAP